MMQHNAETNGEKMPKSKHTPCAEIENKLHYSTVNSSTIMNHFHDHKKLDKWSAVLQIKPWNMHEKKGFSKCKKSNLKQNKVTAAHYTMSCHAVVFGNHTKTLQNGQTQTRFIANNADELLKSIVIWEQSQQKLQSNKNRNEKPNSTLNQHEQSQQHNHNNHQSNGIIIVIGALIHDNWIHHQRKTRHWNYQYYFWIEESFTVQRGR